MDIGEVIGQYIKRNAPRPPSPGEVWRFGALEAHVFFQIFTGISRTGLMREENSILRSYLTSFEAVEKEYKLAKSDLELPPGIKITPAQHDFGFFTAIVPFFKLYVEKEIAQAQSHEGEHEHVCRCGDADCDRKYELPCGHSAKEHLTILEGWYEREILATEKFEATRRAIEKVPYEERYTGLPIIARSDMERVVAEEVERQLDNGLYNEERTEEMVQNFLYANPDMEREEAEELATRSRQNLARKMREELIEKNEKEYRVIDL
ncbi:MAG: hypothetical protein R3251_02520 [Candidatus Spechtbacterales bacterium]|nr:hypothetical protein [Candidatus Spechtbacterales bacterium]